MPTTVARTGCPPACTEHTSQRIEREKGDGGSKEPSKNEWAGNKVRQTRRLSAINLAVNSTPTSRKDSVSARKERRAVFAQDSNSEEVDEGGKSRWLQSADGETRREPRKMRVHSAYQQLRILLKPRIVIKSKSPPFADLAQSFR